MNNPRDVTERRDASRGRLFEPGQRRRLSQQEATRQKQRKCGGLEETVNSGLFSLVREINDDEGMAVMCWSLNWC